MIYTITGATGNIGSRLAELLLEAGHAVRVIGREAGRLEALVTKGAKAYLGDIADTGFLTRAFAGSDAVFAMLPSQYRAEDVYAAQARNRESLVAALQASGVSHVVALSSIGADQPSGTGIVATLRDFEQGLASLTDTQIKFLRPGFFLENLFNQLPVIRNAGIVATSVEPDKPIPMVATRDIAAAAAKFLLARDFTGHSVQYLLGARDYTFPQATELLGRALDKPQLSYVQIPYLDESNALVQAGLSLSTAEALSELNRGVNTGALLKDVRRSPENTTPTSLEDFLPVLVAAYQGAGLVGAHS
ncbi:MAG TPA: NAD(P)H-binding protein [Candidatus Obscuribacterales bacterium]